MTLKMVVHEVEQGGSWAEVPAIPRCFTQGETLPELEANLREAIRGWLVAAEPEDGAIETHVLEVTV